MQTSSRTLVPSGLTTNPVRLSRSVRFSSRPEEQDAYNAANNAKSRTPRRNWLQQAWHSVVAFFQGIVQYLQQLFQGTSSSSSSPSNVQPNQNARGDEPVAISTQPPPKDLSKKVKQLQRSVTRMAEKNRSLQQQGEEEAAFRKLLNTLPQPNLDQLDAGRDARLAALRQTVSQPLGYSYQPTIKLKTEDPFEFKTLVLDLPTTTTVPSIRTNLPIFQPPSLADVKAGQGRFSIPKHGEVSTTHKPNARINPKDPHVQKFLQDGERGLPFLRRYGQESLSWSREKSMRDLLQNFYDDGHTLEGVQFDITYNPASKTYHVEVSGKGEFNHAELEDFGAGEKTKDPYNAGGYGEGSKVLTQRLLSAFNVPKVTFRSADWELSYQFGDHRGQDRDRLYSQLKQVPYRAGNSVSFDTQDHALVESLLKATHYFYHPENPDFQAPHFENAHWGYKLLGPMQQGNLYLANQRFESPEPGAWDQGLKGLSLWAKRKPKDGVLDYGRDRTAVTTDDIEKMLKEDFLKTLSSQELVQAIADLKDYWSPFRIALKTGLTKMDQIDKLPPVKLLKALLSEAGRFGRDRNIGIRLPEESKYLALPRGNQLKEERAKELQEKGYTLCFDDFSLVGMPTVRDYLKSSNQHQSIEPTPIQAQKIQILKQAGRLLLNDFIVAKKNSKEPSLRAADLDQPVYLYDRFREPEMENVLGQAITEEKNWRDTSWHAPRIFKGCWLDSTYLNQGLFPELLGTYLHELSHQFGGDGTEEFSYKLTDWMKENLASTLINPETRLKLQDLMTVWNELSSQPQPPKV